MLTSKEFGQNYITLFTKIIIKVDNPEFPSYLALLTKLAGSAETVFVAMRVFYWVQHATRPDGLFYKTAEEMARECGISQQAVERSAKKLKGMGIIRVIKRAPTGNPTTHYGLDVTALLHAIARLLNVSFYWLEELLGGAAADAPQMRRPKGGKSKAEKADAAAASTPKQPQIKKIFEPLPDAEMEIPKPRQPQIFELGLLDALLAIPNLPDFIKVWLEKHKLETLEATKTYALEYNSGIPHGISGMEITTPHQTDATCGVVGSEPECIPENPTEAEHYAQKPVYAGGYPLDWEQVVEIGQLLRTPTQRICEWIQGYGWQRFEDVARSVLFNSNIRDRAAWIRSALEGHYYLSEARMMKESIWALRIPAPFILERLEF